jgi:hypothetical protein
MADTKKVKCYDSNKCKPGYKLKDKNPKIWYCGKNCRGGRYYTDSGCNCSCIKADRCEGVTGPSYMDGVKCIARRNVKHECKFWRNIITPDRCSSSKKFRDLAVKFTNNQITNSKLNTQSKALPLFQSRMTKKSNDIYPINNYDFDYKTAAINKYNAFNNKFSNAPTMSNIITYPAYLGEYVGRIMGDKLPSHDMVAGIDDIITNDKTLLKIKSDYNKIKPPYPSFRNDYPKDTYKITGVNSSSYFIKNGKCKTPYITEDKCKEMGFEWFPPSTGKSKDTAKFLTVDKKTVKDPTINKKMPTNKIPKPPIGKCYKPRYMYMDNESRGLFKKHGLLVSTVKDFMDVTPEKLLEVMSGNTIDGSGMLPCPANQNYPDWLWLDNPTNDVYDWTVNTLYATCSGDWMSYNRKIRSYRWKIDEDVYGESGEWLFVNYIDKDLVGTGSDKRLILIKVRFDPNHTNTSAVYKHADVSEIKQATLDISTPKAVWDLWNGKLSDNAAASANAPSDAAAPANAPPDPAAPLILSDVMTPDNHISISNIYLNLIGSEDTEEMIDILPVKHKNKVYRYSWQPLVPSETFVGSRKLLGQVKFRLIYIIIFIVICILIGIYKYYY